MTPIFVVVTTGGEVHVCNDEPTAKAIPNGTVYRVSGAPKSDLLVTLSGAGSPYTLTTPAGIATGGDTENL